MAGSQSATCFVLGTQTRDLDKHHQQSLTPLLNKLPIMLPPHTHTQKKIQVCPYASPIFNTARGEIITEEFTNHNFFFKAGKYSTT